jgi:hypothetical protein
VRRPAFVPCGDDPDRRWHGWRAEVTRAADSTLAGMGGAVAWPLGARAQQVQGVRRIAVMMVNAESDPEGRNRIHTFRQGLQDLGWVDGRNVRIDYRWGAGNAERPRAYAAELVSLAPDVILANGTPASLLRARRRFPFVFLRGGRSGGGQMSCPLGVRSGC